MKGFRSKRYAVFGYGANRHSKRISLELVLLYRKPVGRTDELLQQDVRRLRDETAAHAVKSILYGCSVKISNRRRVKIPRSSSIGELKLRLAAAGRLERAAEPDFG